jgi:hypothetical protein
MLNDTKTLSSSVFINSFRELRKVRVVLSQPRHIYTTVENEISDHIV